MRLRTLCVASLLALLGCASAEAPPDDAPRVQEGTSTVESGSPCVPAAEVTAGLPASYPSRLPLPPGAVLTFVGEQGGVEVVTARAEASVDAVLQHFRDAAEPAGFVVTRDEDEGRAGELLLFGSAGDVAVTVGRLTCPAGSTAFTVQLPSS